MSLCFIWLHNSDSKNTEHGVGMLLNVFPVPSSKECVHSDNLFCCAHSMLQATGFLSEHLINPIEEDAVNSFRYEYLQYILQLV